MLESALLRCNSSSAIAGALVGFVGKDMCSTAV